ncbi:hypothetical protein OHA61_38430 [Streptomyces sp. NBC_00885]|uniref:hypothetical protein n=1 Tax=Streptomyces sp. NBC_00885 TaxID=2975857 RepID=UPI003863F039|nr:hypothetical protein OHA61_38430 [Streptomyces sp. NBC_00885]
MPESDTTTLKTQYAARVAADLNQNTAEQERIQAEIEALQAQLASLEQDHELLVGMRSALGGETAKPETVPAARRAVKKPGSTTAKTTRTSSAKKTATRKTAANKTPATGLAQKGPTLTDLVHQHLNGQTEPRTAAEIAKALAEAHPERNINDNLVRTTTERLVARSKVVRAKQGATVFYTTANSAENSAALKSVEATA